MAATSKSPRKILLVGYLIGKLSLPDYSHKFSPKRYTQPQLFACLVLKELLHRDYRGIAELLKDTPELAASIDLERVPHFTALQKAAKRLLRSDLANRLLDKTVRLGKFVGKLKSPLPRAAMDGTGLESHHASAYYVRRKAKGGKSEQKLTYQRFPKAGLVSDCRSHMILAVVPGRGPGPDITHFQKAFNQAQGRIRFTSLAADAGYDAEHTHVYGRSRGVRTLIPPLIGRPTNKPPAGYWRRTMLRILPRSNYTQRWQSETVNSMLKRLLGSALRARTYWSQCREIVLRALTLNIMILRRREVFYRADLSPFPLPFPLLRSRLANAGQGETSCSRFVASRFSRVWGERPPVKIGPAGSRLGPPFTTARRPRPPMESIGRVGQVLSPHTAH
jgi:Transposase DDE domain